MPLTKEFEVIPGTRLLTSLLGLWGRTFQDPIMPQRRWTVENTLCPVLEERTTLLTRSVRSKDPLRLRVVDQYGIVSFIGQFDFELLCGDAKPGDINPWTQEERYEIGDRRRGWVGLHAYPDDVEDDLFLRELELRQQNDYRVSDLLLHGFDLPRYLHTGERVDEQFLDTYLGDFDPLGCPRDLSLEALSKRWLHIQREVMTWQ